MDCIAAPLRSNLCLTWWNTISVWLAGVPPTASPPHTPLLAQRTQVGVGSGPTPGSRRPIVRSPAPPSARFDTAAWAAPWPAPHTTSECIIPCFIPWTRSPIRHRGREWTGGEGAPPGNGRLRPESASQHRARASPANAWRACAPLASRARPKNGRLARPSRHRSRFGVRGRVQTPDTRSG